MMSRDDLTQQIADLERRCATQPLLTPLDALHRAWHAVAPQDRLAFLCEMLLPNERRALWMLEQDHEAD